jgi:hypothetical protein
MIGAELLMSWVFPFLLVFVIVFALLEKTKLLGDGVSQIDALVSLAVAILSIAVPYSRDVISAILPWMAVGLVSLFVFFVLYSFIVGDKLFEEKKTEWLKYVLIGIVMVFVLGVVFQVTGLWQYIDGRMGFFNSDFVGNALAIIVGGVLIYWVFKSSGSGGSNK